MKRILLKVAYDGAAYHGWQVQPGAVTIEGVLNEKLSELTGEEITVIGASRTDAGVHALANVAVFDTEATIPPERFSYALNTLLPDDISCTDSFEVPSYFHPRKTDTEKTYEYTILNSKFPVPGRRNYTWHVKPELDVDKMRAAASVLVGPHDFRGFCSARTQADSTVRTIYSIYIFEESIRTDKSSVIPRERDATVIQGEGEATVIPREADASVIPSVSEESPDCVGTSGKETYTPKKNNMSNAKEIKIVVCGDGFLYNMVRIIAGTLANAGGLGKLTPADVAMALETGDRRLAGLTAPPQGLCLADIYFPELED